jgi:hypothetical protein
MSETQKYPDAEFAALVNRRQEPHEVPHDVYSVATMRSSLVVRRRGAFLMHCSLTPQRGNAARQVFYCPSDGLLEPKLRASHPMMPAGPSDGAGGQHGPLRWLDYDATPWNRGPGRGLIQLTPKEQGEGGLLVRPSFHLKEDQLRRSIGFANVTGDTIHTSLGFHDYLHLPQGDDRLRINGQPLDDLLEERGAEAAIMGGDARIWRGFGGAATVQMPDGGALRLSGEAFTGSNYPGDRPLKQYPVDMMIWSRPDDNGDNPFICLEPVIGVEALEPGRNEGLELFHRHDGVLDYTVQAL